MSYRVNPLLHVFNSEEGTVPPSSHLVHNRKTEKSPDGFPDQRQNGVNLVSTLIVSKLRNLGDSRFQFFFPSSVKRYRWYGVILVLFYVLSSEEEVLPSSFLALYSDSKIEEPCGRRLFDYRQSGMSHMTILRTYGTYKRSVTVVFSHPLNVDILVY